jgi:hypothetical protein
MKKGEDLEGGTSTTVYCLPGRRRYSTRSVRWFDWYLYLRYELQTELAQDDRDLRATYSTCRHVLGTTSIIIAILAAAPKHQTGKFIFCTFIDGTDVDGDGVRMVSTRKPCIRRCHRGSSGSVHRQVGCTRRRT